MDGAHALDEPRPLPVRPFSAADLERGLAGALPGTPEAASEVARRLLHASARHPLLALVAGAERPLGVLRGDFTGSGYCVAEVHAPAEALPRVVPALVAEVRRQFPGQHVDARASAAPADAPLRDALAGAGFDPVETRVHYGRPLAGYRAPEPDPFAYRPYDAGGKQALREVLALVFPGSALARRWSDPLEVLDDLLHRASVDGQVDTSLWRFPFLDGRLAGVVLARLRAGGGGSLLYFALVPELQGRGLARVLHMHALALLERAGATRYDDGTTADNRPMQRVFERNGCARLGESHAYRLRRAPPPPHLGGFAALLDHLRAEGYACRPLGGGWVRVPARFGPHEAVLELGWVGDAGMVQVVHRYPFAVPGARDARLALAVCKANAELSVPGFSYDEKTRALGFRVQVPLDRSGELPTARLATMMATAVNTVAVYRPSWRALVGDASAAEAAGAGRRTLLELVPLRRGAGPS